MAALLVPFGYDYMLRAIWVSALIGGVCAVLSCFLILKGWSMMGDALAHAVVPGVAVAYLLALPFSLGAFVAGLLAAGSMALIRRITVLKPDAVMGLVLTSFFALGLVIVSLNPVGVRLNSIIMGNVLAIADADVIQVAAIAAASLAVLAVKWRDLVVVFFDPVHARAVGLDPDRHQALFFVLLAACTVAALQTVGALLVIAMVITPGATAYLLTDRFGRMIGIAAALGAGTGFVGAYLSFFLDGATGGIIVLLQTALFLAAFVFAPRHGRLALARSRRALAAERTAA